MNTSDDVRSAWTLMNEVYARRVRMLLTCLLICFYRMYTYTQLTFTCITRKSLPYARRVWRYLWWLYVFRLVLGPILLGPSTKNNHTRRIHLLLLPACLFQTDWYSSVKRILNIAPYVHTYEPALHAVSYDKHTDIRTQNIIDGTHENLPNTR